MAGGKAVAHAQKVEAAAAAALGAAPDDEDIEKDTTKDDKEEVRRVRKNCQNILEFAHVMLGSRKIHRTMIAVARLCMKAEHFQNEHALRNRSARESSLWWSERAADLGLYHITEIFSELDEPELLQDMSCHMEGCSDVWLGLDCDHPLVAAECESAAVVGNLGVALVGR